MILLLPIWERKVCFKVWIYLTLSLYLSTLRNHEEVFNYDNKDILVSFFQYTTSLHRFWDDNSILCWMILQCSYIYLKWMVQCHKDVYKNSRLRLEYAYLPFNKFIINRINSEIIKEYWILMLFLVTESSCDDSFSCHQNFLWENVQPIFLFCLGKI